MVAAPARSQELSKARRLDFRLGASLVWIAQGSSKRYPKDLGLGFFPAEIGVGLRLTDNIALALLGRAGLFHVGGGLELTAIEQDWANDGSMLRVAIVVLRDSVTCFTFEGQPDCAAPAVYLLGEVGFQYRWSLGSSRAVSLGVSVQVGQQRLIGRQGFSASLTYGLLGPRLQAEF